MDVQATAVPGLIEGRRERKKRELRDRIYHTARELFLAHGVEATTVEHIAAAADVAPATFFNHFQSKDRLLQEMTGEVFERLEDLIDTHLRRPGPTRVRIGRFVDQATSEIEAARGLAHDVLLELIRSSGRPGELVPYLPRVHGPFTHLLREGQERGDVRADVDAGFLAEMVVGVLNAALVNWMNDARYPVVQRLRQAAVFIGEAIAPRKSRRSRPRSDRARLH
jgi:AcrR family transcriptional regulator